MEKDGCTKTVAPRDPEMGDQDKNTEEEFPKDEEIPGKNILSATCVADAAKGY